MKVQINCLFCNKEKEVNLSEVKRGFGKFCNQSCRGKYKSSQLTKKDDVNNHNVVCATCKKTFYKTKYRLTKSKSGLFFCTRRCKDKAQCIGGIKEIMPSHFGTGKVDYRRIAFEHYEQICNRCGYNKYPIMIVHHIDRDRNNSDPKNLEILCSRCHDEEHFLAKDGKWGSGVKR